MSLVQFVLGIWGVGLVYLAISTWHYAFKHGLYKAENLNWDSPKREVTGFVGTKIGPLVIGEQIGSVKTKETSKKK